MVDPQAPVLIDQGTADGFLDSQLKPKNFSMAAAKAGYNVEVAKQKFVSNFTFTAPGSAAAPVRSLLLLHLHLHEGARGLPRQGSGAQAQALGPDYVCRSCHMLCHGCHGPAILPLLLLSCSYYRAPTVLLLLSCSS